MLKFFHVQRASLREITRNNKHKNIYFSVVCLEFFVSLENFHSIRDIIFAGEGLEILTYALHSWSMSSEGSLAGDIICDRGHTFIMVISEIHEDSWHLLLMPSVWQWSCQYLTLRSVAARTPILRLARQYLR